MSLRPFVLVVVGTLAACGRAPQTGTPAARVRIAAPAEGATVTLPFTVRLEAEGVEVVPADGARVPGKGHHHLFVDADPTPADSVIPKTAQIVHLGSGASEHTVDALEPGTHRIIAVFADGAHVPVGTVARDTIEVTVAPQAGATP